MSKSGYTALNQANWIETINVEHLKTVQNPSLGNRHRPIQHGEALELFQAKAQDNGLNLLESVGFLSPEEDKFIFVAETKHTNGEAYGLGFVNFNDRSRSFVGLASQKVFVCSNLCFGGVFSPSRTRHTTNVDERLGDKMDIIFDNYSSYVEDMESSMGFLKEREVDDAMLGKILVNLHRSNVMGATNLTRIIAEYDDPTFNDKGEGKNGLRAYNAMTHTLKRIKNPMQNIDTGHLARKVLLDTLGY